MKRKEKNGSNCEVHTLKWQEEVEKEKEEMEEKESSKRERTCRRKIFLKRRMRAGKRATL